MENIGFKTTAFKSENYTLQKATSVQNNCAEELHGKQELLIMIGMEKSQKILLQFLENKIFAGVMIEELNQIKRHFFSQE